MRTCVSWRLDRIDMAEEKHRNTNSVVYILKWFELFGNDYDA